MIVITKTFQEAIKYYPSHIHNIIHKIQINVQITITHYTKNTITACAKALCSVKDGFSSEGKTVTYDCSPDQTMLPMNTKLGKINYVGEFYKCAKFHSNQLRNGSPRTGEI